MPEPLPIRLAPVVPDGWRSKRAGFQWLVPDGGRCAAHQIIAHCVYGFSPPGPAPGEAALWSEEQDGFRITLIARYAGIVRHARNSSHGGWHDMHEVFDHTPGTVIGTLTQFGAGADGDQVEPCLTQIVVGRKASKLCEDLSSLHSGWHDRRRTWPVDGGPPRRTVLGLGICELTSIMLGKDNSFSELLPMFGEPVHLVNVPDVPLVPTARIVAQQMARSEADRQAIWADFCQGIANGKHPAQPDDWVFGSSLIKAVCAAPANEDYQTFSSHGINRLPPADTVIMSLSGESPFSLRHRKLGYDIRFHSFRFQQMGPALRSWVQDNFAQIPQNIEDVRADYLRLLKALNSGERPRQLMLLNALSSLPAEYIQSCQSHDEPARLKTVWAKQINLMAEELARDHNVVIVDADAIGAELGSGYSAPDGIHHSGEMQRNLRGEIVRCLNAAASEERRAA
jgi:hypothetical protein